MERIQICNNCGRRFSGRKDAKYCCDACKVEAYRERHGIQTRTERTYSVCQREGCGRTIPTELKATAKYCSNACRQKVYNDKPENKKKAKQKYISEAEARRALREYSQKMMALKKAEEESNRIADEWLQEQI